MPTFRPGKPRCILGLSANFAHGTGDFTLPFDTAADEDPIGQFVGNGIEILKTGLYLVTASINCNNTLTTEILARIARLRLDATTLQTTRYPDTSRSVGMPIAALDMLDAGVNVSIQLNVGTATVLASGTRLAVTRVGPERWT